MATTVRAATRTAILKPGRNDPCPCGSGKKYKRCCQGKSEPNPPAPGPIQSATLTPAECNQIVALANAGCHDELEAQARLLTEKYPESGLAWQLLGIALRAQGKAALPVLQKVVQLLPDDTAAHNSLGIAQQGHGQLDNAVASFRRALRLNPDFAEAHSNLGNALRDSGQMDAAMASYRRALALKPDFPDALFNMGISLVDLGQMDAAMASYRRALALKPDFAEAHSNLGIALQHIGQLDAALASYRRALEIDPEHITQQSPI